MMELFALIGWAVAGWNTVRWLTGHHVAPINIIAGVIMGVAFTGLSIWRLRGWAKDGATR
jgi:hypothetical protein